MKSTLVLVSALSLLVGAWAGPSNAHINPPEIAFYGGFAPSVAYCQRVIGRAAEQCVASAIGARTACLAAQFAGGQCDSVATDAVIAAARQRASAQIGSMCSADALAVLQFGTLQDAQQNIGDLCGDLETAAASAGYGSVLASGAAGAVEGTRPCVETTAQVVGRLTRFATRTRRHALDRMAVLDMSVSAKLALLQRAADRIAHARTALGRRVEAACPQGEFAALYGRDIATLLADIDQRSACLIAAAYVQATVTCPAPVCGNGMQEPGEQCDDGNDYNDDGCRNDCTKNNCTVFPSTFALIQQAIFARDGCTDQLCHGSAQEGSLDLRPDVAYASLVARPAYADPRLQRVVPGDERSSLLYLKLAAKTLGDPDPQQLPGSPMPLSTATLTVNELAAMRLWIHNGAPRDTVVAGTASLLDACLPPPSPPKVPRPDPPAPGAGRQFAMPTWLLPAHSEGELCTASYYDLSAPGAVPAELLRDCTGSYPGTNDHGVNAGKCFPYNTQYVVQDPQGHHLWELIYSGTADYMDPIWGAWACAGGAHDGEPCDPASSGVCEGGACAAITGPGRFCGPPQLNLPLLGFGLAPVTRTEFPDGVFAELPLKGIVVWDLHAFNVTGQDTRMAAWSNHDFAQDRRFPAQFLFDLDYLFTPDVPPFETREYCATHTFDAGSRAFSFRSHTHKRGKRFRMWRPPQTPCGDAGPAGVGDSLRADPACKPGDPQDLFYENFQYNEPVQYAPNPPMLFSGSVEDRTIKFCALYDNGATNASEVKRASTSPLPFLDTDPGGPCPPGARKCLGGPNVAQLCGGSDANCPQSVCDACDVRGGVTTDDEMFGFQVYFYFIPPG